MERFYDVDAGSVTIDGHDVRDLDPAWLRGRAMGFINQEPVLFATSVMENIRYGRPDASDAEVRPSITDPAAVAAMSTDRVNSRHKSGKSWEKKHVTWNEVTSH